LIGPDREEGAVISFVIPTLNEEKTLERTLRNVTSFSGEHEVIVSDGNSADATIAIGHRYADRVVVHDSPARQTIGQARTWVPRWPVVISTSSSTPTW
jgi:glycosyltransferase involved in cell wall biosynthesis